MTQNGTSSPRSQRESRGAYFEYAALAMILLFAAAVRMRLLQVPFERDEGEYGYFAQLMLRGIPPYLHAYSMKLPGVAAMYALFMAAFGSSVAAIHAGLLIVNAGSVVMVWAIARRLLDRTAALCAAAVFALLSLGGGVLGVFAHATNFVIFFALAGYVLLFRALDRRSAGSFLLSGLSFGAAFLMKQHGAFFALFALLYLAWRERGEVRSGIRKPAGYAALFLAGLALPFGACCLLMSLWGVFDRFWFWTFRYAAEYVSETTFSMGATIFASALKQVTQHTLPLWIAAAAGVGFLFVDAAPKESRRFLAGFSLFSFLAICPGLYFRSHYFVLILPAVALLAGLAVSSTRSLLSRKGNSGAAIIPAAVLLVVLAVSAYVEREYLFVRTPDEVSRMLFKGNPFPESRAIAQYLRERTEADDRIAVLGSEPQIFFYADRLSATGHIYMYWLVEKQKYASLMQRDLAKEVEAAQPKFIVASNVQTSWLTDPEADTTIFDWAKNYIAQNYERVGVVDIFADTTVYRWDGDCAGYAPRSQAYVYVYRRKGR